MIPGCSPMVRISHGSSEVSCACGWESGRIEGRKTVEIVEAHLRERRDAGRIIRVGAEA